VKRGLYVALILSCLGAALWFYWRKHDNKIDQQIAAQTLGPSDSEKIIIDQKRHTIVRVKRRIYPDGPDIISKSYLNPHGPVSLTEKKDGTTVLVQRTWGTIREPFIGIGFGSDLQLRAALGMDLLYVQRWEMGGGLLLNQNVKDTRLFAHVGYNAYGNTLVSVGVDNRKTVHLLAILKF
jgi:hypothetical protein